MTTNLDRTPELSPLLVRPRQAEKLLGIKHTTLFRLLGTGQLRSVQIGSARLIPMDEIEKFVEQRRKEAGI